MVITLYNHNVQPTSRDEKEKFHLAHKMRMQWLLYCSLTTNNVPHIGVLSSRGINEEPISTDVTVSSNFEGDQLLLRALEMQQFPKRSKPGAGPAS